MAGRQLVNEQPPVLRNEKLDAEHPNDIEFPEHFPGDLGGIARHCCRDAGGSDRDVENSLLVMVVDRPVVDEVACK